MKQAKILFFLSIATVFIVALVSMSHQKPWDANREFEYQCKLYTDKFHSRDWVKYVVPVGGGWQGAACKSGLANEINEGNKQVIAEVLNRDPRNDGVDVYNPQPKQVIYVPKGASTCAKAGGKD